MANRKARIEQLKKSLTGLANDARFWELCRTYGDHSSEVLSHLETCARVQATDQNHT